MTWDLIGDIHGHDQSLCTLLHKLGYRERAGCWRHPTRRAIFLGDFIDRGPAQREVLDIVRPMIEQGAALAVMGNHEYNAIGWATPVPNRTDEFLRPHTDKNRRQHRAFLDAFENDGRAWRETIDWFLELPLWLELDGLRVVHACWDKSAQATLAPFLQDGQRLSPECLPEVFQKGTAAFEATEVLLKGREIPLPDGYHFFDKDGNPRHHIRVRWWDAAARTYRRAFLGPRSALRHIPDLPIRQGHVPLYPNTAPPVFIGHYWLQGEPTPLAPNIACLDYSVAKPGPSAQLVAYRWDGEQQLDPNRFVSVPRQEDPYDR